VRAVTVGITLPDAVSIDSGLNAGERVVTDGLDDLRDGSKVQVTASPSTTTSTSTPTSAPPPSPSRSPSVPGEMR
jgi:multidrug efflux system membrane fusion protein